MRDGHEPCVGERVEERVGFLGDVTEGIEACADDPGHEDVIADLPILSREGVVHVHLSIPNRE